MNVQMFELGEPRKWRDVGNPVLEQNQRFQIVQACQRSNVAEVVAVQVQVDKIRQTGQRREVLNGVLGEIQGSQPGQSRERGDVGQLCEATLEGNKIY